MGMSLTNQDLASIKQITKDTIKETTDPKFQKIEDDNKYTTGLLEDINDKFTGVIDGIAGIHQQISILPAMQADLEEVKIDVKAIKAVVMNHESRITKLEAA